MRRRGRPRHPDVLTPREWEVLGLLREELTNEQIAERLGIGVRGARYHVSEIIGKLGLTNRREAAAWRPDGGPRALPSFAAVGLLRRIGLGVVPSLAGGAIVAIALVLVGALIWGVTVGSGGGSQARIGGADGATTTAIVAWSVDNASFGVASVMLFDLDRREARRLPMPSNVGLGEWASPAQTFIGYDTDGASYNLYDVSGTKLRLVLPQALPLNAYVSKAPDGRWAEVNRSGGVDIIDVTSGRIVESVVDATYGAISPDGSKLLYVSTNLRDKSNAVHVDWSSLMLAERDPSGNGFTIGTAIYTEESATEAIVLPYNPWSPDGEHMLVEKAMTARGCDGGAMCGSVGPETRVLDLAGNVVWSASARRDAFLQWAGPDRLFVYEPETTSGGTPLPATQELVTIASGAPASLPASIASYCCTQFSPDGRYGFSARDASGTKRCSLFDLQTGAELAGFDATGADDEAAFCSTISWSADGRFALASRRGG